MSYNHSNQFRYTIIRGKAKNEIDNLLPLYAEIIKNNTPSPKQDFDAAFNESLHRYFPAAAKKTLDNHRTEIAGKLFGMFWTNSLGITDITARTEKLLLDNDQPSFFKDICAKIQFPSGMDQQYEDSINLNIKLLPCKFVLEIIKLAENNKIYLNKTEIGYYVLNNLDVMTAKANPTEVLAEINLARRNKIVRKIALDGHASSWAMQHITELINYLELANLVIESDGLLFLNHKEDKSIEFILTRTFDNAFNIYKYDLSNPESKKEMLVDWTEFYGQLSTQNPQILQTSLSALITENSPQFTKGTDHELGQEGEVYIFNLEKKRVSELFPLLLNKVLLLASQRGIGYDIQSVFAEGSNPDRTMQIEVKSTKRVTQATNAFWDSVTMTRNEWVAAEQFTETFFIYRVYFTQSGPMVFVIQNPASKQGVNLRSQPVQYRVEFNEKVGNFLN